MHNSKKLSTTEGNKLSLSLILATIGVVYGDIGTSPLYTIQKCFAGGTIAPSEYTVLGVCSLIIWALILVVTLKYVTIVLNADNKGEGGILALVTLNMQMQKQKSQQRKLILLGCTGIALSFGDGIITPAISVLSAIEGINVLSVNLNAYVIPAALTILLGVFFIQQWGAASIGRIYGPVICLWFVALLISGLYHIVSVPRIMLALNPIYGMKLIMQDGFTGFYMIANIVLAVTGVEALYADLGNFGKRSIKLSWYYFVFPALCLNYLGQGALLLEDPAALVNPFYLLFAPKLLVPMIILSTLATIIASQALISGIFSITYQAIELGYLPKMVIKHTSAQYPGQVYVPVINKVLCALCVFAVIAFRSSDHLAAAYGFTIVCMMLITAILTANIALRQWQWNLYKTLVIFAPIVAIDVVLVLSGSTKIMDGGWFTLLIATITSALMCVSIGRSKILI